MQVNSDSVGRGIGVAGITAATTAGRAAGTRSSLALLAGQSRLRRVHGSPVCGALQVSLKQQQRVRWVDVRGGMRMREELAWVLHAALDDRQAVTDKHG